MIFIPHQSIRCPFLPETTNSSKEVGLFVETDAINPPYPYTFASESKTKTNETVIICNVTCFDKSFGNGPDPY